MAVTRQWHWGLLYRGPLETCSWRPPSGPRGLAPWRAGPHTGVPDRRRPNTPPFPSATWATPFQPPASPWGGFQDAPWGLGRGSPSGSALPRGLVARPMVACGGGQGRRGTREAGAEASLQSPRQQPVDAPCPSPAKCPASPPGLEACSGTPTSWGECPPRPPALSSHRDPWKAGDG